MKAFANGPIGPDIGGPYGPYKQVRKRYSQWLSDC